MATRYSRITGFTLTTVALAIVGCSSSSDTTPTDDGGVSPTADSTILNVDTALAGFPNNLLPRFALASDGTAAAAEIYRRVDYDNGVPGDGFWGVEGASTDEAVELESRYAEDGTLVESTREVVLDEVPPAPAVTLASLFPDAEIEEIVQAETDGLAIVSVLLDADGAEIEVNLDESGLLHSIEEIVGRDDVPEAVIAVVDAQANSAAANLPEFELERETLASGAVRYAVEFESDEGQSLTIMMDLNGTVLRTEHEDALANLATGETVEQALENFPLEIEADFAAAFPEVVALEVFRNLDLSLSDDGNVTWGIEGISEDETIEIEALYAADGTRLADVRGTILEAAPANILGAFTARYPEGEIEEVIEVGASEGVRYEIAFVDGDEDELEVNLDAAGGFISLERAIDVEDTPAPVLASLGERRVVLAVLGIEVVESADGSISYGAEYETADGDDDGRAQSISYSVAPDGTVLAIEHEGELPL